jgi:hypothetical protein
LEFGRLAEQQGKKVDEMISVYEIRGMRELLLHPMRRKFGELPEPVIAKVKAMDTDAERMALSDRIMTARTLHEMDLPETENGAYRGSMGSIMPGAETAKHRGKRAG